MTARRTARGPWPAAALPATLTAAALTLTLLAGCGVTTGGTDDDVRQGPDRTTLAALAASGVLRDGDLVRRLDSRDDPATSGLLLTDDALVRYRPTTTGDGTVVTRTALDQVRDVRWLGADDGGRYRVRVVPVTGEAFDHRLGTGKGYAAGFYDDVRARWRTVRGGRQGG